MNKENLKTYIQCFIECYFVIFWLGVGFFLEALCVDLCLETFLFVLNLPRHDSLADSLLPISRNRGGFNYNYEGRGVQDFRFRGPKTHCTPESKTEHNETEVSLYFFYEILQLVFLHPRKIRRLNSEAAHSITIWQKSREGLPVIHPWIYLNGNLVIGKHNI